MASRSSRIIKEIVYQLTADSSNLERQMTAASNAILRQQNLVANSTKDHVAKQEASLRRIEALNETISKRDEKRAAAKVALDLKIARLNEQKIAQNQALTRANNVLAESEKKLADAQKERDRTVQSANDREKAANNRIKDIRAQKQQLLITPVLDDKALKRVMTELDKARSAYARNQQNKIQNDHELENLRKRLPALKAIADNEQRLSTIIANRKNSKGQDWSDDKKIEALGHLKRKTDEYHRTLQRIKEAEAEENSLSQKSTELDNRGRIALEAYNKAMADHVRAQNMSEKEKQEFIQAGQRWLSLTQQEIQAQNAAAAAARQRAAAEDKLSRAKGTIGRGVTTAQNTVSKANAREATIVAANDKAWEDYNRTLEEIDDTVKKAGDEVERVEEEMIRRSSKFADANDARRRSISLLEDKMKHLASRIDKMSGNFGSRFLGGLERSIAGNRQINLSKLFNLSNLPKLIAGALGAGLGMALGGALKGLGGILTSAIAAPFKIASNAMGNFFNIGRDGFRQVGSWVQQAVALNREMLQFSVQTGMSIQQSQKFIGVFKAFGLDVYWTSMSIGTLRKELAANNAMFGRLGIATRDAAGNIRNVGDVIDELNVKYQEMSETARENFLGDFATEIPFGSMILPAITVDPAIRQTLKDLNVELDALEQHDLNRATGAMQSLEMAGQGLSKTVTAALAPALETLANLVINGLVKATPYIHGFFRAISNGVVDALQAIGLLSGQKNIVGEFTDMFEQSAGMGAGTYDSLADSISDADRAIMGLQDSMEALSDTMEDQQDIIQDLRDAMADEIEVLDDAKEAITDQLNIDLDPIEDQIELLEDLRKEWEGLAKIELTGLQDNIDALEDANDVIKRDLEDYVTPLENEIWDFNQAKDDIDDQRDLDITALGPKPSADGVGDQYQPEIDQIEKEITAIQKLGDAYEREQNKIIKARNKENKELDKQIQGINKASEEFKKAKDKEKKILEESIAAKQREGQEDERLARQQEYYDRRAYLMGETLLAQQERRLAFLSDRQARQRQSGESDIDYQLRIQQLNTENEIGGTKGQEELAELDKAWAIDLENQAREASIALIQAEIAAIDAAIEVRAQNDEAAIAIIQARKDEIELELESIREAMDLRKEADDLELERLNTRKDTLTEVQETEREAAEAAVDDWEKRKDAIDAAADAQIDAIEEEIESRQELIDLAERAADIETTANDRAIDEWQDKLDIAEKYWETLLEGNQDAIDAQQEAADDAREIAQEAIESLNDQIEAIRDRYDIEIEAQETILEGLQDQLEVLQDQEKELQKIKKATEEIALAANSPEAKFTGIQDGIKDLDNFLSGPNSPGRRVGKWIKENLLYPFMSEHDKIIDRAKTAYEEKNAGVVGPVVPWEDSVERQNAEEEAANAGASDKRPSVASALKNLISNVWDELTELWDDEVEPKLKEYGGRIVKALLKGVGEWIVEHPTEVMAAAGIIFGAILLISNPIAMLAIVASAAGFFLGQLIVWLSKEENRNKLWEEGKKLFQEILEGGWEALKDLGKWLWDNIAEPIIKWIAIHKKLIEYWTDFWLEVLTGGWEALKDIAKWLWEHIAQPIIDFVTENSSKVWEEGKKFFGEILNGAWDAIKDIGTWLKDNIWTPFWNFATGLSEDMLGWGGDIADSLVTGIWDKLKTLGSWIEENIVGPVATAFGKIPGAVGSAVGTIWNKISGPLKTAYDGFANFINLITGGINSLGNFLGLSINIPNMPEFWSAMPATTTMEEASGGFYPPGMALGGRVSGTGGEKLIRLTEEGHDEWVVPSNPAHRPRARSILSEILAEFGSPMGVDGPMSLGGRGGIGDFVPKPNLGWVSDTSSSIGGVFKDVWNKGGDMMGAIANAPKDLMRMAKDQATDVLMAGLSQAMGAAMSILPETQLGEMIASLGAKMIDMIKEWFGGKHDEYKASTPSFGGLSMENIIKAGGFFPSQDYGWTREAASGTYRGGPHTGVDFGTGFTENIPMYAPAESSVAFAGWNGGYGNTVILNLIKEGFQVLIAHMNSLAVQVGELITDMDHIVGYSGNTGNSSGPHTHIETRDPNGQHFDPSSLFPSFGWAFEGQGVGGALRAYASGGIVRPRTKLYDSANHEFYGATEDSAEILAMSGFKPARSNISPMALQSAVSNLSNINSGPSYSLTIGEIHANTKEDAQAIGDQLEKRVFDILGGLPQAAASVRANRNGRR